MTQNSRGFALVVPLILVFIAVGVAGYLAYQSGLIDTPFTTIKTTSQPSPTTTYLPTKSGLFKDAENGFSLSYSEDWQIIDDKDSGILDIENDMYHFFIYGLPYGGPVPDGTDNPRVKFERESDIFAGKDSEFIKLYYDNNLKQLIRGVQGGSDQYLVINLIINESDYISSAESTFDQILSTFQFTDKGQDSGFVCPQQKSIDCTPCTGTTCPLSDPQYCHKGTPQYNWIVDNCPDVEIINAT